jgi:hypothetical protein
MAGKTADVTDGIGWGDTGPFWAARAFHSKRGQDHLGLASVSQDHILPTLSPGINVLTPHPRYWSFYLLVLDDFWRRGLRPSAFRDFFRAREAAFSMACHVCDATEHTSIQFGINGALKIAPRRLDPIFEPSTAAVDYMVSALGGYGLYYRTAMESTGVLAIARRGSGLALDAPTPTGQAIAAAYRRAIAPTTLWARYLSKDMEGQIQRDDLVEFAHVGCLCQLPNAGDADLPLLQDLFLHELAEGSAQRRDTMRMLLDLGTTYASEPIDEDTYRRVIYFRQLNGTTYQPRPDLEATARYWRILQAREYFAYAFNRLLEWLRANGAGDASGVTTRPVGEVEAIIDTALSTHTLNVNVSPSSTGQALAQALAARVDVSPSIDMPWPSSGGWDERELYLATLPGRAADDANTFVRLLSLLTLVHHRLGTPDRMLSLDPVTTSLMSEGASQRIGMALFFRQFNELLKDGATVSQLAHWIIDTRVITQHERVAVAKLPDDTFRVRRMGTMVAFSEREAFSPFNSSRFNALSTMVHELGFISAYTDAGRRLTPAGAQLLGSGDLPATSLAKAARAFEVLDPTATDG